MRFRHHRPFRQQNQRTCEARPLQFEQGAAANLTHDFVAMAMACQIDVPQNFALGERLGSIISSPQLSTE
jgi:hypothetical protein